ncbi:hypothetical protein N7532_011724 [Penicillium argentinense]|uniref:HAT C-terminal dimerisation domain-containing protein n=1 Tax=Penicillium argentinense TaxID=1131581 RepID=A0A9W9JVA1_9EURO|nr:uncharacterized protein N7532_011724 [Penicillium argentinense]KAJ5082681.1 hypothetical protein N7532_011724 [Penicillium argentinense]
MLTRGNHPNYLALNDGYEDEAPSEDWLSNLIENPIAQHPEELSLLPLPHTSDLSVVTADTDSYLDSLDEVLPSESASQLPPPATGSQISRLKTLKNDWLWGFLHIREFSSEWIEKRSRKKRLIDREISCTAIDKATGKKCNWSTTDSKRQTSTTNIRLHLKEKHGILPPNGPEQVITTPKSTLLSLWGSKANITIQQILEKNLLRWVVSSKQPFTVIESPDFQQLFKDIPGVSLPFSSRHTLRQRLLEDFDQQRANLKEELAATCKTIALSLDVWTSKNHLPILGVIGHWLTEEFDYRERVLEFTELHGPHSGENLATAIETLLIELNLEHKLLSITGDNARNNERMVLQLFEKLQQSGANTLFCGLGSYVRCLAHIINLIVKDILSALKSGNTEEATSICDNLDRGEHHSFHTLEPLAKLRILAIWIHRSPQRRQAWKNNCKRMNLPEKFIQYDVDTRWNSTFRMISDALKSKDQLEKFIHYETEFLPFSTKDWERLSQIHSILSKFDEFTLFVSEKRPQISLTVPVYYELHGLLHDAAERKEDFADIDEDIASAVRQSIKKYMKYYTFMDISDTYYTALILDPRVKGDLLLYELEDKATSREILQSLRDDLYSKYPETSDLLSIAEPSEPSHKKQKVGSRMLRRLQPHDKPQVSDIDRYFDSARVDASDMEDPNWLCDWWRVHKHDYPRMAAAARDYLAIPASEVSVERLFNAGRDVLGVRRYSMKAETMRVLMLLNDVYK